MPNLNTELEKSAAYYQAMVDELLRVAAEGEEEGNSSLGERLAGERLKAAQNAPIKIQAHKKEPPGHPGG